MEFLVENFYILLSEAIKMVKLPNSFLLQMKNEKIECSAIIITF